MTQVHKAPAARSQRDLVTNPAFDDLLGELTLLVDAETQRLTLDAGQLELSRINYQAGVVEGAKRALNRIKTMRSTILESYGKTEP